MNSKLQHTLIRASAGTGKTHQLANRYIALLLLQSAFDKIAPERLVALTFTRKGAGEFADRILFRLATAARDKKRRAELQRELELVVEGNAEQGICGLAPGTHLRTESGRLQQALALVIDQSDRLALGTIDSFMARSVQTLAFELALGGFEILEEAAAEKVQQELLVQVFREAAKTNLEAFYQNLKRATLRSASGLQRELRTFVEIHHQLIRSLPTPEAWGGAGFWNGPTPANPGRRWQEAALALKDQIAALDFGHKGIGNSLASSLNWLARRVPGTTGIRPPSWLDDKGALLALWDNSSDGDWQFEYAKKLRTVSQTVARPLREILRGWVTAERAAFADKTAAIYEIVSEYEQLYDRQARRKGRLTFDDLPLLLNTGTGEQWSAESVSLLSFRWFLQFDHWLLDEFQDTSRLQWEALKPWVDEALQDDTGRKSVFVVGDPKQSIYGWRGGEPRLFEELKQYYPGVFSEQIMAKSWRSRPAVLELVNRVCDPGQNPGLRDKEKFLAAGLDRWRYDVHQAETARSGRPGYAAVLLAPPVLQPDAETEIGEAEAAAESVEKLASQARIIQSVLADLKPVERGLSCAILVRKNENAHAIAQWLRSHGMPNVMVEGDATLADQSPVVVTLVDVLRWLDQPAHTLAGGHLQLTPLWKVLQAPLLETGIAAPTPGQIWRFGRERMSQLGAAELTCQWCRTLSATLTDAYSQHSLRQVDQLANRVGRVLSLPDWLAALEQLTVHETAAAGCVHVMTIHKAKGLGFDLVLLPDLDSGGGGAEDLLIRRDPQGRPAGCLVCPPKWLRAWIKELQLLKSAQELEQDLEALCVLYVALTRAKEATFVILQKEKPRRASQARTWLLEGIGAQADSLKNPPGAAPWGESEVLWEVGDRNFSSGIDAGPATAGIGQLPVKLALPVPRRERRRPSEAGHGRAAGQALGEKAETSGREFGTAVHEVFEQVEWWDSGQQLRGSPEAVTAVEACLEVGEIKTLFTKDSPADEAHRELPLEWLNDDIWWSGVADRLVLRRHANGTLLKAALIDFKTDPVEDPLQLRERYSEQLAIYKNAVAAALDVPPGKVETVIVSTHRPCLIAW